MRHKDLPERWEARFTELALAQSGGKLSTLGASAFDVTHHLRITFMDGSRAFFHYAFYLTDEETNEIAVFTEHCGHHVFPSEGTKVEVVTSPEARHCCEDMRRHVNHECDVHTQPFDCPDRVVYFDPKADTYGLLIHDGGSSFYAIKFCPWCGARLPNQDDSE